MACTPVFFYEKQFTKSVTCFFFSTKELQDIVTKYHTNGRSHIIHAKHRILFWLIMSVEKNQTSYFNMHFNLVAWW